MFPKVMEFETGPYIALCVLPDGKLLITLTSDGWNAREEMFESRQKFYAAPLYDLFEWFWCNGYEFTHDLDWWEQMSSAPAFSDAVFVEDNGDLDVRHFWYYNEYQTTDELAELYEKGYLVWDYFDCEK